MRTIQIVLGQLNVDKMKAEENLQRAINSTEKADYKVGQIREALKELVDIDNMVNKLQTYIPQPTEASAEVDNNNNNN